jgi:uncharacterized small protein (DUF1192 family)
MTGHIQRYSIQESRLLDPPSSHPSPPTVLAVSSTSQLMLSASENPPVVHLRNLTLNTPAIQLHPSASNASVATASFHPERPSIFLLGFKDGTLAAYDATKMSRSSGVRINGNLHTAIAAHAGEISHLSKLHSVTNVRAMSDPSDASFTTMIGGESIAITGAAFLPGYRTRAVSVGADGRCRLIDFEAGGKILRTWHAQAPVTSLSILTTKGSEDITATQARKAASSKQNAGANRTTASTDIIIAVGRVDGQVLLFDSLGLRLDQVVVDALGRKVISVEWMKGPSPYAIASPFRPTSTKKEAFGTSPPETPWTGKMNESQLPDALKLPPGAVFTAVQSHPTMSVHDFGTQELSTVRHNPTTRAVFQSPAIETTYLDLFSPVKKVSSPRKQQSPVASPPRPRPRLSSQTFIRDSSPDSISAGPSRANTSLQTPKHLSIHPLSTAIVTNKGPLSTGKPPASARRATMRPGPRSARKRNVTRATVGASESSSTARVDLGRNGQVLADLRRLNPGFSRQGKQSGALFAAYMNRTGISDLKTKMQPSHVNDEKSVRHKADDQHTYADKSAEKNHFETESHSSDRDIWMSAGSSEDEFNQSRNNRRTNFQPHQRNSGRARPESLPGSEAVISNPYSESHAVVAPISPQPQVKGKESAVLSMSDDAMYSAVSRLSNLDGGFVPGSEDVQRLCPRGSSLKSTSPSHLQSTAQLNAIKRGEAAKKAAAALLGPEGVRDAKSLETNQAQSGDCTCLSKSCQSCAELNTRVRSLEDEVARLKAEVLGLRSALRKTHLSGRRVGDGKK